MPTSRRVCRRPVGIWLYCLPANFAQTYYFKQHSHLFMNSLMSECKFMRRVWLCRRIRHVDWNVRSRLVPGSAGDPLATAGIPLATGYALLSVGVGQLFKYYRGSRCFSLQFFVLPLDWNIRLTVPNFRSRWRWDVWLKACRFREFGPVGLALSKHLCYLGLAYKPRSHCAFDYK